MATGVPRGARLREGLLDKTNTASAVWADTAYRSKANEAFLEKNGFVSPLLYALYLMEWYEPAFNAVEFVMLGVVQIAVIALVMRPIERRYGMEKEGEERR